MNNKFFVLLFFILSLFLSCKTIPETPDVVLVETEYIPLEPGALVYLLADVKAARPILDLVPIREMNTKESKQMLDRTQSVAAALYPPESGRRFQLTAWGQYPGFQADLAFGSNKNWKKQRSPSGLPYWYSAPNRLSLALSAKRAFVSALINDTPGEPFASEPGVKSPEGFGQFRRGAILCCWLEKAGPMMDRIFAATRIPLRLPAEQIFVSLFPVTGREGQYEALLRIQTPSPAQARALVTLFALAGAFLSGGGTPARDDPAALAALLFANPPVQDGANLNIKTAVLTETEIALLFNLFSVYSGQ